MKPDKFPILIIAASLLVTPVTIFLAISSAGVGHGNLFWAILFFPYYMILTDIVYVSMPLRLLVFLQAIIQFPVYGVILAWASKRNLLFLVSIGLVTVHVVAVIVLIVLRANNPEGSGLDIGHY